MSIHVSVPHKLLGVPLRQDLANLFPDARRITWPGKGEHILVPHDETAVKLLKQLGLDAPAPIMHHYEWPHPMGKPPFEKQKLTAAMLTTNQRAYVLNGMGTGKTRTTLWAFDYLRKQGLASKMLVVAPLSTITTVWAREVFQNFNHLKCSVLYGDKKRRLKRLAEDADIFVINPDGLATILAELEARTDIDVFVIDEIATFRNPTSRRNKIARKLAHPRKWAWGLTGSPTPEAPTDAWGQCQIITPHTVPRYFGRFRDEVMVKLTQFKYAPRPEALNIVHRVMQPAVRYTLDDIIELPELIERTVDVELGTKQARVYEALRKDAYAKVLTNEITAVNAGAVLSKLLQVSLGYVYTAEKGVVELDNAPRIQALVDIIDGTDRKAIVFAPFRHAVEGFSKALTEAGNEVGVVTGEVGKKERDEIFNLFQNTNRIKVIVADPRTMAHGLTLTAADTIVWAGPIASLEVTEQANARIRRLGQTTKQQVLMLQSTAAERKIYAGLLRKQRVQDGLLQLFEDAT